MMTPEFFADTVSQINFTDGLIRVDFVRLTMPEENRSPGASPKQELVQRVVIPMRGMMQCMALFQNVMSELEKKGLVRKLADPQTQESVTSTPPGDNWSKNFRKS